MPKQTLITPDLDDLLDETKNDIFANLNCIQIGKISSYDTATQSAEITLQVKRRDNQLVIEVADSGCGFTPTASTAGSGTGIANVQARLAALFGSAASLVLEERSPAGVLATLVIPETSS